MSKSPILILLISFLSMSFSLAPAGDKITTMDPYAYVSVNGDGSGTSNTLTTPLGVACGGGYSSACELYLIIDVDGDFESRHIYVIAIYKNNSIIDWYAFYSRLSADYSGYIGGAYEGDEFHIRIES